MRWHLLETVPVKRRVRITKNGRTYTDAKTASELKQIEAAYDGPLHLGAVAIIVKVYRSKKMRKGASEPFCQKPDADNILKAVMDGLNGKAYKDDRQVTKALIIKEDRQPLPGEWCRFAVIPADDFTGAMVDGALID